ncbi:hypothetical protein [Erwinia phage Kuerle]|nr:hypothetical protein [Erwinia phage Kuerle]
MINVTDVHRASQMLEKVHSLATEIKYQSQQKHLFTVYFADKAQPLYINQKAAELVLEYKIQVLTEQVYTLMGMGVDFQPIPEPEDNEDE